MTKRLSIIALTLMLAFSATPASAQTPAPPSPSPAGAVYIVQAGDTLWDIAALFNTGIEDIMAANGLPNADIYVGDRLVIPGLEGLNGTLITKIVPFGETLRSLSRQYHVDETLLRKLNHIVSPTELYAGAKLVILQQENQPGWPARSNLNAGETMLELAVRQDTDPWTLTEINRLSGTWAGLPSDVLYLPSGDADAKPTGLPAAFASVEVTPLPPVQGTTVQIHITVTEPVNLGGMLIDHPLHFFQLNDGSWVALQGVHAMTEPGIYPLRLEATLPDGSLQSFEQMVLVKSGYYPAESINGVEPDTIDPTVTGPEDQWLLSLISPVTPEKYWQGTFQLPVDSQYCIRSKFGNRRSYNGGVLNLFHTGIDFGVCSEAHPFDIYAPADGVVVFTGLKTVRGNATIIEHGWGIYSGLYHQEEIYVAVGDHVTAGQLIGKIGATGRVTGPHLHWEIWVNGIQVNPLEWLQEPFPR
jgi:murein DD-endopeptidase MepM/ murein hydrolase activator NlpD